MPRTPTFPSKPFAAVIVAAGSGVRAKQGKPKQFADWRGKPVLEQAFDAMKVAGASPIVVVVSDFDAIRARAILDRQGEYILARGGSTRQASVRNGLEALAEKAPQFVLIHDAARPDLPVAVVERLLVALDETQGAIPVLPVADSMVTAHGSVMGQPVQRESLRRVQTPQAFAFDAILSAHRAWEGEIDAGDDAQVMQNHGGEVALVDGDERLRKLTYSADFEGEASPVVAPQRPAIIVGSGYDVHRLAEGEELWLCGVRVEHTHGLAGHSDADVALHALVDAILGAAGHGDIGQHFPPSDPNWRGASSSQFVEHAVKLARHSGYTVGNVDVTIICEAPKIGPYRERMRERVAQLLDVDTSQVNLKATTTEKLGFTGRGEGIAAQAVATLVSS